MAFKHKHGKFFFTIEQMQYLQNLVGNDMKGKETNFDARLYGEMLTMWRNFGYEIELAKKEWEESNKRQEVK